MAANRVVMEAATAASRVDMAVLVRYVASHRVFILDYADLVFRPPATLAAASAT
jgi:hypothetical protein